MPMRRVIFGLGLAAALAVAAPCAAQVLEIGEGGAVTTYAGPAVTTREGVTSLIVAAPTAAGRVEVEHAIVEAARQQGVREDLVRAVAVQESGLRQEARSPKGAVGVMQLMPATARALGVDALDLRQNVQGGVAYLSSLLTRFEGNTALALAAYNAGPGAVLRYGGTPPFSETRDYVRQVLARIAATAPAAPALLAGPPE